MYEIKIIEKCSDIFAKNSAKLLYYQNYIYFFNLKISAKNVNITSLGAFEKFNICKMRGIDIV